MAKVSWQRLPKMMFKLHGIAADCNRITGGFVMRSEDGALKPCIVNTAHPGRCSSSSWMTAHGLPILNNFLEQVQDFENLSAIMPIFGSWRIIGKMKKSFCFIRVSLRRQTLQYFWPMRRLQRHATRYALIKKKRHYPARSDDQSSRTSFGRST